MSKYLDNMSFASMTNFFVLTRKCFSDGKRFSKKYTVYKKQLLNKFKKKQYKLSTNLLTGKNKYQLLK